MFSLKNTKQYLFIGAIILVASLFANKLKQNFESNDEYELIRKYLLNDSPLYGYNRPKLWIHTKYEINSRKWKNFYSRNTTDLNQPYLHLTIKTIINLSDVDIKNYYYLLHYFNQSIIRKDYFQ